MTSFVWFFRRFPQINVGGDSVHFPPLEDAPVSLASLTRERVGCNKREQIREEERRKILKELRKEKHAFYSSHDPCKSLSEELCDYYEGRHRSHLRPHSHRIEK